MNYAELNDVGFQAEQPEKDATVSFLTDNRASNRDVSAGQETKFRDPNYSLSTTPGMSKMTGICFICLFIYSTLAMMLATYAIVSRHNYKYDVDDCESSPCMNNGQCIDGVNQFRCLCAPGWEGDRCHNNTNECASSPCRNDGVCEDRVNAFTCACPTGYEGVFCEMNVDDCGSSPCMNNGQCIDGVNQFRCLCSPGWEGDRCQNSTTTEQTPTGSSSFIRWGRSDCPNTSDTIYSGYAAGTHWSSNGSGANFLCLHGEPEYDSPETAFDLGRARIDGVEIETSTFPPLSSSHNHDMVCVVCRAATRGLMVMIPAKVTCPADWTREYHGYLMSSRWDVTRTEFICVDRSPTMVSGTRESEAGSTIYPVEGRCLAPDPDIYRGGLPCDKFPNGNELSCVVCTK